ncbi:MAG: NHLP bacteriocin export ABC transporter permease/ATPase subunit [Gemmatimonadaceae bacterium]
MIAEVEAAVGTRAREFILGYGTPADVGSDRPFAVAGDMLWLVESGFVDVFMVTTSDDGQTGPREHIARVLRDGVLVGFGAPPPAGASLLAVGAADTRLWSLGIADLRDAIARDDVRVNVVPSEGNELLFPTDCLRHDVMLLAEGWAASICAGITSDAAPRKNVAELPIEGTLTLTNGTSARPATDIIWVEAEGTANLAGRVALPLADGVLHPISRELWVKAAGTVQIRSVRRESIGDALWPSLANLQVTALAAARENASRAVDAVERRRSRQAEENASALGGALRTLAGAMRLGGTDRRPQRTRARDDGAYDALLTAMRRVGDVVGVTITPPENLAWVGVEEPVDAVARSSRFRTRRVILTKSWWKRDAGPLLGFLDGTSSREAVALLPRPGGGYDMHRKSQPPVRVTAATAALLIPSATAIYRPFPATALTLSDVLRFALHGCWRDIITVGVLGAVGGALAMVIPFSIGLLFDTVIPSADRGQLLQLAAVLIVVAMASMIFELVRTIALLRVEGRMQVTVQAALWDRLLELPTSFFRTYAAGDLAVRAMSIDGIRALLTGTVTTALVAGIFSVFNFAMMFVYSSALAWRGVALILTLLLVTLVAGWLQLSTQRHVSLLRGKTSGLVLQLLSSIAKLRVAGAEVRAFAIWARHFGEQRRQQFKSRFVRNAYGTLNIALPTFALMVIFGAATAMMQADAAAAARGAPVSAPLRTGEFLAFLAAFSACLAGTLATGASLLTAAGIVPLYEQARPIFTTAPEVGEAKRDPGVLEGDIEAQHLSFRYLPGSPLVLNDLSFRIRPGECVALVGPSGSGKSSIIRALLGFEALETGSIYLDGHDMSGLDMRAVRRQIGVVLQQSRLNAGDIYANIVGSSLATEEDAWAAAEMAGLAADIREMPMGMNTVISEGGGTLSGGQRQRLMIARAFVRRPKIVLFDEATSALDNHAQAIVSESLAKLRATRIIVAHRLSTVMGADRILVVIGGQIVEHGSYSELMRQDGAFAELARRQLA